MSSIIEGYNYDIFISDARKTSSLHQASAFGRRSRPSADEDGWQSKGDRWVSEFVEAGALHATPLQ
jgi:hypothetical protein